jgi:hypothetical protein
MKTTSPSNKKNMSTAGPIIVIIGGVGPYASTLFEK